MAKAPQSVNASGWRATIKRWRRHNRARLNRVLTRFVGTGEPRHCALAGDTHRILVVRLNKRLGNILFLTPLLRTLAALLPAASIDVLVQDVNHRPLLESLPGINRVWVQNKTLPGTLGLLRRLRRERYDLAIDPSGNSTSNRLAIALSGARQRMGFAGPHQWLRLSHAAPHPTSRHQAKQAVELLTGSLKGPVFECFETLAVYPDSSAQSRARAYWDEVFDEAPNRRPVVGFFAHATGRKQLPATWWQAWQTVLAARAPDARLVQIRPPNQPEPVLTGTASVAVAELDMLAAFMAQLDAFIAADSGPMHLAAAAGVPVVGLFRATDPRAYAPLCRNCISLSGDALTAEAAAQAVARILTDKHAD